MTMDFKFSYMDISIMDKWPIYKSEQFRTPLSTERAIGLWVDRIGGSTDRQKESRLRVLGQYAVVYVVAGNGEFFSPTTGKVAVGPRQAMILFPQEPNIYRPLNQWTTKWIVWNGPEARLLEELGYLSMDQCVLDDRFDIVDRAFMRLSKIIAQEDLAAVLDRKNIILEMILELFKHRRQMVKRRNCDGRMEQAVEFLGLHYIEEVGLASVARQFSFSPVHFRRMFKHHTGISPKEFVTSLRISKAKELLSQGRPIKEVAKRVGYEDIFYFMRVFKKATGISPGKFTFIAT
ncbi:MAG: AraC family transcriptional regulator [Phycisphaerae bacterium]